jgi:adenylate cyclase
VGLAIAVVVVVVALVAIVAAAAGLFFNVLGPAVDSRRRAKDDNYFFNGCRSGVISRYRWINRHVPASPRCKLCLVPFGGLGRIGRIKPSRKNANFCRGCFEMAPLGGFDMEVGVLFADLRGFTSWCETRSPAMVAEALNRFYAAATSALMSRDGLVDKLIGDEVMGLFVPVFSTLAQEPCGVMVDAAYEMLERTTATSDPLPVGIGLTFGMARVGNVGAGEVKDFTAVGDVVNTAARLQASASPGEILMSAEVYERVAERYPGAEPRTVLVRGKSKPLQVYALGVAREPSAGAPVPGDGP